MTKYFSVYIISLALLFSLNINNVSYAQVKTQDTAKPKKDDKKSEKKEVDPSLSAAVILLKRQACLDFMNNFTKSKDYKFKWENPTKPLIGVFGGGSLNLPGCGQISLPIDNGKSEPAPIFKEVITNTNPDGMLEILSNKLSKDIASQKKLEQIDLKPFSTACMLYKTKIANNSAIKNKLLESFGNFAPDFPLTISSDSKTINDYMNNLNAIVKKAVEKGCDGKGKGKDEKDGKDGSSDESGAGIDIGVGAGASVGVGAGIGGAGAGIGDYGLGTGDSPFGNLPLWDPAGDAAAAAAASGVDAGAGGTISSDTGGSGRSGGAGGSGGTGGAGGSGSSSGTGGSINCPPDRPNCDPNDPSNQGGTGASGGINGGGGASGGGTGGSGTGGSGTGGSGTSGAGTGGAGTGPNCQEKNALGECIPNAFNKDFYLLNTNIKQYSRQSGFIYNLPNPGGEYHNVLYRDQNGNITKVEEASMPCVGSDDLCNKIYTRWKNNSLGREFMFNLPLDSFWANPDQLWIYPQDSKDGTTQGWDSYLDFYWSNIQNAEGYNYPSEVDSALPYGPMHN